MKKSLLFIAVAVVAISFTSCKKDYTCECKDSSGAVLSTRTINNTQALAKTECETSNVASSTVGITCTLK